MRDSNISNKILKWYDNNKRILPWRKKTSTKNREYFTLVSEFMLQQTQVKTVIPYFENFIKNFPNLKSLANANEQKVLKNWEGLGYYSRARNLKKTAIKLLKEFKGQLPKDVEKADSLDYVLANSDYITLHVPLVEATKNLISKNSLKTIKTGAKIINLSRGGIVNSDDVIEALKEGKVSSFVTDFPTPNLINRANQKGDVILLPHLGASTKEAEINCAVMASTQVVDFLKNGVIVNSVNFPSIKLGRSTKNRLVIINKNEPGMIGKIADALAKENINIADMTNKSRDDIAINLIDIDQDPSDDLIKKLSTIDHVLSVRNCT